MVDFCATIDAISGALNFLIGLQGYAHILFHVTEIQT